MPTEDRGALAFRKPQEMLDSLLHVTLLARVVRNYIRSDSLVKLFGESRPEVQHFRFPHAETFIRISGNAQQKRFSF